MSTCMYLNMHVNMHMYVQKHTYIIIHIDVKNIKFKIKNMKKHVFYEFKKNIKNMR